MNHKNNAENKKETCLANQIKEHKIYQTSKP